MIDRTKGAAVALVLIALAGCHGHGTGRMAPDDSTGQYLDRRDGRAYRTTSIGGLVWFAENLAYMPHVSPSADQGGIWVYGYEGIDPVAASETPDYRTYGNLYDWATALRSCPDGWHVASDEEWRLAEMALGMTPAEANGMSWRGSNQGTRMKRDGDSGFDAVLAGWRSGDGRMRFRGEHANFWTATSVDFRAYKRLLNVGKPTVGRDLGNKTAAFSVRCVQRR